MKNKLTLLCGVLALWAGVHHAPAQNTVFTYQGLVTDDGSAFTGAGQFQFALVTSAPFAGQATAVAVMGGSWPNMFVQGITPLVPGYDYLTAPAVTFSGGGGAGAAATAKITGGGVTSYIIINSGYGYNSAPMVTIAPPFSYLTCWSNDGTSVNGSEPAASVSVAVTNGLFTVVLGGNYLNMQPIPTSVFNQPNLLLQIWFNDGTNGFAALNPPQPLTPTPYAVYATSAGSVAATNITGTISVAAANITGTIPTTELPASVITNGASGVNLSGTFTGNGSGVTSFPAPLVLTGGLNVDHTGTYGLNPGTVSSNALTFGTSPSGSGEGIASKRVGANPYDLEFFTGNVNRMTILNNGWVGIGTTNPATTFQVDSGGTQIMALNNFGDLICSGSVYADGIFSGNGSGLTSLNASQLTSGVIPQSVLPGFQSSDNYATVSGGYGNSASAFFATVGGGSGNSASAVCATVGGGSVNSASTNCATVGGGSGNSASAFYATVGGGNVNSASSNCATVGGGLANTASAFCATVGGGEGNSASGQYSFAAGQRAQALHQGAFVWADSQDADFASTANDQVSFRCAGGVRFTSASFGGYQTVAWIPGSGSWSFSSDRNLKDRFANVDAAAVLDKVAQLPVMEWSYQGYPQRHIGAMAQDFHGLFPLNDNDKSLNDADLHGVELAAIKGLNQKLEQKETEITELKARLEKLEQLMNEKNGGAK